MRVKPYKGKDKFIFFSYSHKDIGEVLEIIGHLQRNGYNVWFDEGIDPGTEWDDNIALHIELCSYYIAYVTNNYVDSQNCRDELNYARDLEKDRLMIYGEDADLPRGMKMRMNRLQAICKYRYRDQEDFYEKLYNTHGLEACRNKTEEQPAVEEVAESTAEEKEKAILSLKERLRDLLGDAQSDNAGADTTKKIDKFYKQYRKNEEFQRKLDEEYEKLKRGADSSISGNETDEDIEVGDCVLFGSYKQDNAASNGKEDIEWLVLARSGSNVLVVSKYALDNQPYNAMLTYTTWETSTIRKWLNSDFFNTAFTDEEKSMIRSVAVSADKNPACNTPQGNDTTDKVFLLSIAEANKYFSTDDDRQCQGTAYCYEKGASKDDNGNCWWWLRSSGVTSHHAADVDYDGSVYDHGDFVNNTYGAVRPAIWINLDA